MIKTAGFQLKRRYYPAKKKKDMLSDLYDAQLLKKIRHPNIVRVYEITQDEEEIIFYEQRIKAKTLTEWAQKHLKGTRDKNKTGLLKKRKIKRIMRQICSAAGYLHNMEPKKIIHGDIKPGNIMITRMGRIKLIDFSASVMYRETEVINETDETKQINRESPDDKKAFKIYSTPQYTAPEVYEGEAKSPQRDIYGIGMTLLYMLRGEKALKAADVEKEILTDKTGDQSELLEIAYWCIRREQDLRYQSAKQVIKALKDTGVFSSKIKM